MAEDVNNFIAEYIFYILQFLLCYFNVNFNRDSHSPTDRRLVTVKPRYDASRRIAQTENFQA